VTSAATVAVFDIGKSNVKLSACTGDGEVAETLTAPNPVLPGPPWRHHGLAALRDWLLTGLATLAARHPLDRIIVTGHGSGCVLVTADPDAPPALPMIDYEQPCPVWVDAAYADAAGDIWDRGSAIMMGATHNARQMLWSEMADPAAFALARWVLAVPQYWAFVLSGVAVAEVTALGAQSHLWNVRDRRPAAIVARRGWDRLMPPLVPATAVLGPVRPALCRAYGVPPLAVHAGAHDSSASFHRNQAAGLQGFAAVSTGTWIVALTDLPLPDMVAENRGMTLNADSTGRPALGALTMGGREFAAIADDQPDMPDLHVDPAALTRIVASGTSAVPTFGANDGQFPGSAGRGRIVGSLPDTSTDRHALALLHVALLTLTCGNLVAPGAHWVLDGSFLRDPSFARLIAALRPGARTDISAERYGVAAGAAMIATGGSAPLPLTPARPLSIPGLGAYAERWHALAEGQMT
jgi:sugar (pentulose or hexulose) kinase